MYESAKAKKRQTMDPFLGKYWMFFFSVTYIIDYSIDAVNSLPMILQNAVICPPNLTCSAE